MLNKKNSVVSIYAFSFLVTAAVFFGVGVFSGPAALLTVLVLCALEITFSFDNAVVNAKVLQKMPEFWQRMFLTVGILIAVFGMRLVLPIMLVSLTAGLSMGDVVRLALDHPDEYARYLTEAHPIIASFGGIFLLMIFLEFILDYGRKIHWFRALERPLMQIGRLRQVAPLLALTALVVVTEFLGGEHKFTVLIAGVLGIITYLAIRSLAEVFELKQEKELKHNIMDRHTLMRAGFVNFLYLELLDASFSFDGVIGAFAITNMVLLIAAGLGVGAMWVRSMTIHIVRHNTLLRYRYLDHGAHYAIGALAVMLLLGIRYEIHEAITGTIGIVIIGFAFFSSWRYNVTHKPEKIEGLKRSA
jgi:hypothetical protein